MRRKRNDPVEDETVAAAALCASSAASGLCIENGFLFKEETAIPDRARRPRQTDRRAIRPQPLVPNAEHKKGAPNHVLRLRSKARQLINLSRRLVDIPVHKIRNLLFDFIGIGSALDLV